MSEPEDYPHGHTPPEAPPPLTLFGPTIKVRILSGNQAGQIHDLPRIEAEVAIQTGYGEAVGAEAEAEVERRRRAAPDEVAERLGEKPKSVPSAVAERLGASPTVKRAPESP